MAKSKTAPKEVKFGKPLAEFEAAVEALQRLQREGKFQLFLCRDNIIKVVGNLDEFRVVFGKIISGEPADAGRAKVCLEEVQSVLQVVLATPSAKDAVRIIEQGVYSDEFGEIQEDAEKTAFARAILNQKVDSVSLKIPLEPLRARGKRLATASASVLEDVDVEVISRRKSLTQGAEITAPFLRLAVRYTGSEGRFSFPFSPPPWITNIPSGKVSALELECDESDIDLLIGRLLEAKEFLRKAIEAKVERKEPDKLQSS